MHYIDNKVQEQEDGKKTYPLFFNKTDLPQLKEGEQLLKVSAIGINRAELLQKRGAYPPPPGASTILGLECVGFLVDPKTLEKTSEKLVGTLVGGGSYAEYCTVCSKNLIHFPPNLSLTECASIPEGWLTAFQLINKISNVQPNEWVLIPASASGVG